MLRRGLLSYLGCGYTSTFLTGWLCVPRYFLCTCLPGRRVITNCFMKFWSNPKWYWVRWVLLLPLAFIAYTLVGLLFNVMFSMSMWFIGGSDDSPYIYVGKCISSVVACYNFIIWGALCAPSYRKYTALVLMILMVLFTGMVCFALAQQKQWGDFTISIVGVIGLVGGYVKTEEELQEATS